MVFPGIASHSPRYQTLMEGWVISSAESCDKGAQTMSFCGMERYFLASSLVVCAKFLKISQSVFDSHTGATARDKGWIKEWRSVLLRSAFSYQEAAGKTMSE